MVEVLNPLFSVNKYDKLFKDFPRKFNKHFYCKAGRKIWNMQTRKMARETVMHLLELNELLEVHRRREIVQPICLIWEAVRLLNQKTKQQQQKKKKKRKNKNNVLITINA